jgi:hypothetical protein
MEHQRDFDPANVSEWDGPAVLPPNPRACLWGNQEEEPRHAAQV